METLTTKDERELIDPQFDPRGPMQRRLFLGLAGLGAASVALTAVGCKKVEALAPNNKASNGSGVDLGSGDIGILNYAYALEQLEAAYYIKVTDSFYKGISSIEKEYLGAVCRHEVAHREFFKSALGSKAIPNLEVDFSKIDFTSRDSVLGTAKVFEDLGVSAYNGAGYLIKNADYLLAAGKIVSVEARHAALFRDLISYGSFSDSTVVDANGMDKARTPAEVLEMAGPYIKTKINASNLPTS
jgi:hypothetical protein